MYKTVLFTLFLLFSSIAECKLPNLSAREVKAKIEEILKAHATYKELNTEIMERSLTNFCDELDPMKVYFLESEIEEWIHPEPDLLKKALQGAEKGDFSLFQQIHALFIKAVARHNQIEETLSSKEMPKDVKHEELKNLGWAKTEEGLSDKILKIKALQLEAAAKMGEESDRFFQHIQKRRLNREAELANKEESTRTTLTYALKAIASALDAHTNYFTPSEANQFIMQVQQRLFGIGAQLRDDLDGLRVTHIIEDSPASHKMKINDKIIGVDGEPVIGLDIIEAVEKIRGEKGTTVQLSVLREIEGKLEKLEIPIVRGEIVLEEARLETSSEPYGDGVIAYLRLFSFYQDLKNSSALDIRKAIDQLKQEHKLKGVILDLRSNAGGLLSQAVSVTGLFITKGVIVSVKDNTGNVQHLRETEGKPAWDGPLFVLVNRASASAAEIVAQTLQDYGRALVLGDDHTFGKGTFQTFTLDPILSPKVNPMGEYKVTRGKYYTVSGKTPQLVGV
ncbi:MAG: PDZ domain-containing protein, partial [Chlamydiia bacterium]|nr:PDZ domain-containing protein [Chlamydiia bacterium]